MLRGRECHMFLLPSSANAVIVARYCKLSCHCRFVILLISLRSGTSLSATRLAAISSPCRQYIALTEGSAHNAHRYPATSLFIALGRLGIVLLVGLSYPLQLLPCRACVDSLTSNPDVPPTRILVAGDGDEAGSDDEEDPLMPKDHGDDHALVTTTDMSNTKFVIITAGILVSGFLIALAVDELEVGT